MGCLFQSLITLVTLALAAHFFRATSPWLTLACLLMPFLLLVRAPWSARLYQAWLGLGALVWIVTAGRLVQERMALGQSWFRLALIMGLVTLLTAAAALLFETEPLRREHHRSRLPTAPGPGDPA